MSRPALQPGGPEGHCEPESRENRPEKTETPGSPVLGGARLAQPQMCSAFAGLSPPSRNCPVREVSGAQGVQNEAKVETGLRLLGHQG